MRPLHVLALITFLAGSASASTLSILNLPLVNGVLTLSGTAGETVEVDGSISPDQPIFLDNAEVTQVTTQGNGVSTSTDVFFATDSPFYNYEIPTTTPMQSVTTGALFTVTFPMDSVVGDMSALTYTLDYFEGSDNPVFTETIDVQTVSNVPEPAYTGLIALALAAGWYYRRRKHLA